MSICCFDLWSQLRNIMSADRNSICSITMLRTIISFLFTLSLLDSEPLPWSFHRHRGGGWYIPIWRKWGRDKIGPWLDPFWDAGATLNENVFGKASLKWSLAYLAPAQPSSRPWANKPCHAWIKTSILHEPWQWSELTDKKKKKIQRNNRNPIISILRIWTEIPSKKENLCLVPRNASRTCHKHVHKNGDSFGNLANFRIQRKIIVVNASQRHS